MTDTANLGLPCIEAAQAQKHVTHNEALRLLDTLVQLAVLDRDLAAPPGAPAEGQRWIVAASPTGAWSGHADHVAAWQDGGWQFSVPLAGWLAFAVDEGALVAFNGTSWNEFSTASILQGLSLLGVGTTADATNPFSAKLNNALWVARAPGEGGTGDLRYKLSKAASGNTLSLLLQDNFSGRAEIGLTGDDDFHFKVSPDGSSWSDALVIQAATGNVAIAGALDVSGNVTVPTPSPGDSSTRAASTAFVQGEKVWEKLSSTAVAGASSVSLTWDTAAYRGVRVVVESVGLPAGLRARFLDGGTPLTDAAYLWSINIAGSDGSASFAGLASDTAIALTGTPGGTAADGGCNMEISIGDLATTGACPQTWFSGAFYGASATFRQITGAGTHGTATTTLNGIQLYPLSGTFSGSGAITLYGLRR
jgi:hypothetical protein